MFITAEEFERRTGRKPEQDDLERVNCRMAGHSMHQQCGWCETCNKPVFECLHTKAGEAKPLAAYQGTYLGFAPTDESAVVMGEIEITIAADTLSVRMATGLEIQTDSMSTTEFVSMSHDEVAAEYQPGSDAPLMMVGFKSVSENGAPKLLFTKDREHQGFGLIVRTGGMGEILGPTVLFNPVQVARGDFDKAVAGLEQQAGKGVLPRLRNNGKAERQ